MALSCVQAVVKNWGQKGYCFDNFELMWMFLHFIMLHIIVIVCYIIVSFKTSKCTLIQIYLFFWSNCMKLPRLINNFSFLEVVFVAKIAKNQSLFINECKYVRV